MIENRMVKDSLWEEHYRVFARCCECGEEILADGSTYYEFDGDIVCRGCVEDYVDNHFCHTTEIE